MPISILLAPVWFFQAGMHINDPDQMGYVYLATGILLMIFGSLVCNTNCKKRVKK